MTAVDHPSKPATGKAANVVLWILQGLVAAAFLMAGSSKLAGNAQMVEVFGRLGLGQWFRLLTGLLEVAGAILLLVPALCGVGATLLACIMSGAVVAHVTRLGGNPTPAIVLLVLSATIAWFRRGRTLALLGRR